MKLAILVIQIFTFMIVSTQSLTKYFVPTRNSSSPCPQTEQCTTLNKYATDPDQILQSNTNFVFLPGNHQLDSDMRFENLRNISLQRADSDSSNLVTVSLGALGSLTWINCYDIDITSVLFETGGSFEHGLVFVNSSGIQMSNISFTDRGDSFGCSALVFLSSTAQISDSNFVGLSCQLGAIMVASQSEVTFSGHNVLSNNTALLGGAIYSIDSAVTLSGDNQLINNRARMCNIDQLRNQCSNYSIQTVTSVSPTSGLGGAIFGDNSSLVMNGSFVFVNNSAEVSGGAIVVIKNSTLTMKINVVDNIDELSNASFTHNRVIPGSDFQESVSFFSSYGSGGAIYTDNSTVDLMGTTFLNNSSPGSGGAMHFNHSKIMIHNITMVNNSAFIAGAIRVDNEADLKVHGNNYFGGNSASESGGVFYLSNVSSAAFSDVNYFDKNRANRGGSVYVFNASASIEGTSSFNENYGERGGAVYLNLAHATFCGANYFRQNSGGRGSAIYMFEGSLYFEGIAYFKGNNAGRGGALYVTDSNIASFYGNTYFYQNTASSRGGALFLFNTTAIFNGPGETVFEDNHSTNIGGVMYLSEANFILNNESRITSFNHNSAERLGGTVISYDGYIQLKGDVTFDDNKANYGGALALYGSSSLMLSPPISGNFINNRANISGGAIFYQDSISYSQCIRSTPIQCFIAIDDGPLSDISLTFANNSAKMSGNSLHGGRFDSCRLYFGTNVTDLTVCRDRLRFGLNYHKHAFSVFKGFTKIPMPDISSGPIKICGCKLNDSTNSCNSDDIGIDLMPGQQFKLTLASFDQAEHIVDSKVLSNNRDFNNNYHLSPLIQLTGQSCTQVTYRMFASVTDTQAKFRLYFDGQCQSFIGVNLNINILPCPLGFKLSGEECLCEDIIRNFTQNCYIDNSSIERVTNNFWISPQTNDSGLMYGIMIHQGGCPFDYCMNNAINVTLNNPNVQCDNNHSGIVCGACKENFSLALGSLNCLSCSNAYLALVIPFSLAGIVLVIFLFLLHLTVAAGTINGLIFYANIVQGNYQAFFPQSTINFFTVFISWLNLDLGIETCFYNGMDVYAYSWLQFLFPLYLWFLIGVIIISAHCSVKVARNLGNNPIAVLDTLFLMSYSKILKAIIVPLSATSLNRYPSSSIDTVWLYNANVQYFREPGHIVLGVFTVLVLLFLFLPYTFLLLCGHWLQTKSHWKALSWINKLKPIIDAYHAPYMINKRHWTGLLLLTRCGLFLMFALNDVGDRSLNLLVVCSVVVGLAIIKGRVYKSWHNEFLESSFILNLCIFSVATFYVSTNDSYDTDYYVRILSSVSVGIVIVSFIWIVIFHTYQQLKNIQLLHGVCNSCSIQKRPNTDTKPNGQRLIDTHSNTNYDLRELLLDDDNYS